jgi:hypothetical protein
MHKVKEERRSVIIEKNKGDNILLSLFMFWQQCSVHQSQIKKKKAIQKKTIKDHSALMTHHSITATYSNAAPIQSHSQTKEKKNIKPI